MTYLPVRDFGQSPGQDTSRCTGTDNNKVVLNVIFTCSRRTTPEVVMIGGIVKSVAWVVRVVNWSHTIPRPAEQVHEKVEEHVHRRLARRDGRMRGANIT